MNALFETTFVAHHTNKIHSHTHTARKRTMLLVVLRITFVRPPSEKLPPAIAYIFITCTRYIVWHKIYSFFTFATVVKMRRQSPGNIMKSPICRNFHSEQELAHWFDVPIPFFVRYKKKAPIHTCPQIPVKSSEYISPFMFNTTTNWLKMQYVLNQIHRGL